MHRLAVEDKLSSGLHEIWTRWTISNAMKMIDYLDALNDAEHRAYEAIK